MTDLARTPHHVRAALESKLMGDQFSCVAGKSGWLKGTVVHHYFGRMGAPETTTELYSLLSAFAEQKDEVDPLLASFVAIFAEPLSTDEPAFETLLWRQLQGIHDIDATMHPWGASVDADPASPHFAFSVRSHPFFVVGLHPGASRLTRRFAYPALVFNSHIQFRRMRERGMYERIKAQVRQRELALQGSLNPNLADFGTTSEAAQYSGRAVPRGWTCPFRPRNPVHGGRR